MLRSFQFAFIILTLAACAAPLQTPSRAAAADSFRNSVLEAEGARFLAMTSVDFAALDTLLADNLLYTHTSGLSETKSAFLESLRSGRIRYVSINPTELQVTPLGPGAAVVTGRSRMRLSSGTEVRDLDIRFTDVLVRHGQRWQTVVWQSTRVPPP
jgi:hypothetical protein